MDLQQVHVRAHVRLLSTAEGGRSAPLVDGSYWPNHNFFEADNGEMCMGRIDIPQGTKLDPGESAELSIMFLVWPELRKQIYKGREWRIQEGPIKIVGQGTIIEVLGTA